jgi:tetratricopeptide (TPR) repeat protein
MRKYGICFNILVIFFAVCFSASFPGPLAAQEGSGIEAFNAGAYVDAEAKLRMTLLGDPTNISARYYLGLTLLHQKKLTEAVKELEQAKSERKQATPQSRPDVPSGYQLDLALGQTFLELQAYEKALSALESARLENPESSDVYLYRGMYYYRLKEYPKAVEDLEKAIKLNSENAYAYYYAGMAYSDMGQPDKMVEVFKIFLELAPNAPEAPDVKERVDAAC